MILRNLSVLLLLVLSLLGQCAWAQDDPFYQNNLDAKTTITGASTTVNGTSIDPVKTGGFFENLAGATSEFLQKSSLKIDDAMFGGARQIAKSLDTPAKQLAGILVLVYFVYEMVQFMAGRSPSVTQVLFDIAIPAGLAFALIHDYDKHIVQLRDMLDVFKHVGNTSMNTSLGDAPANPVASVFSMYGGVMKAVGTAFSQLWTMNGTYTQSMSIPAAIGATIVDALACVIFLILILYLLITGSAEVLGLILLGPFMFSVGVAFGPIMIAGLVTPWTNEYFKKWLIFLTISSALSGVVNVVLQISTIVFENIKVDAMHNGSPSAVSLVIISAVILTINSMISQAPGITSSLFPGSLGGARGTAGELKSGVNKAGGAVKAGVKMYKAGKERTKQAAAASEAAAQKKAALDIPI